jgi:histone-lysine N-methyltransferase SETD2
VIADKEKKSSSYKEGRLDSLSEEKIVKIKKFAKEYIAKVLRKLEKSAHKRRPPSMTTQATTSTLMDTPNSIDGADAIMTGLRVEETDMTDSHSEGDGDIDDRCIRGAVVDSPAEVMNVWAESVAVDLQPASEPMDADESHWLDKQASDPRRRPPDEEQELVWGRWPTGLTGQSAAM